MSDRQAASVLALKVHQWLADWNSVEFSSKAHRREPPHEFYLFTLNARQLKSLSGIQRRSKSTGPEVDLGIQRRHEQDRSREIGQFVRYGYPWSELSEAKRRSGTFDNLRKPGWLPTALVVNILTPLDRRRGMAVAKADLITVSEGDNISAELLLPTGLGKKGWSPSAAFPIEVIDGQHRLWAFEEASAGEDFELPVVAFHGLDISWQAYLFWTINIKPKKINTSLAFDLYPLLRSEDWLDRFEGHSIYRETRAQELVERLWASPDSPWYERINMLGETGTKLQSQASWVRSLMATFVRTFEGRRVLVGGLFGAQMGEDELVLPWSRAQQATFLIFIWREMEKAVAESKGKWAKALRGSSDDDGGVLGDPAFRGSSSLLSQDQGIRSFLHVINDLCWVEHENLGFDSWETELESRDDAEMIKALLKSLPKQGFADFIRQACEILAEFDWRAATAPGLSEEERQTKLVFRGSGGYSQFRKQLLRHLTEYKGEPGKAAQNVLDRIGE